MTIYLADFYDDTVTASQLQANGFAGASVYFSHQPGKAATKPQVDSYRAAGLIVAGNFEDEPLQCLNGFDQGVADATFAVGFGRNLGYPPGCVIFYSVDGLLYYSASEIPAGDADAIVAYFDGINSAGGGYRVGVYGGISTVELVMGAGKAYAAWQTSSGSDGILSPRAALYQDSIGVAFDQDRVEQPVPLWGYDQTAAPTVTPTPATPPVSKETPDMIVVLATGTKSRTVHGEVGPGDLFVLGPTKMQCATESTANAYCNAIGQTPPWAADGDKYKWPCATLAEIPNA